MFRVDNIHAMCYFDAINILRKSVFQGVHLCFCFTGYFSLINYKLEQNSLIV